MLFLMQYLRMTLGSNVIRITARNDIETFYMLFGKHTQTHENKSYKPTSDEVLLMTIQPSSPIPQPPSVM